MSHGKQDHRLRKECFIPLTKADFRRKCHLELNQTLVIRKPGVYKLLENIGFEPFLASDSAGQQAVGRLLNEREVLQAVEESQDVFAAYRSIKCEPRQVVTQPTEDVLIAISIQADDVVLDLCGHRVYQKNTVLGGIGIELVPSLNNVTIRNGTLSNFTRAAIRSFIPDSSPQVVSRNLFFENLILLDNGSSDGSLGLFGLGDGSALTLESPAIPNESTLRTDFKYYNVIVSGVKADNNTYNALNFNQVNNLKITDTLSNGAYVNNATLTFLASVLCLQVVNSRNTQIFNSQFNNAIVNSGAALLVGGMTTLGSDSMHINNCQFNGHSVATGASALGLGGLSFAGSAKDWLIENSQFNNITGAGAVTADGLHHSDAAGATFAGGPHKVINCQFNNIKSVNGTARAVLFLTTKDLVIDSSQVSDVASSGTGAAQGFSVSTNWTDPVTG